MDNILDVVRRSPFERGDFSVIPAEGLPSPESLSYFVEPLNQDSLKGVVPFITGRQTRLHISPVCNEYISTHVTCIILYNNALLL